MNYNEAAALAIAYGSEFLDFETDAAVTQLAVMADLVTARVPEMVTKDEVEDYIGARKRDWDAAVAYEKSRYETFLRVGVALEKTQDGLPVFSTSFRRETIARGSKGTWNEHALVEADLIEIFDSIEATSLCPYVAYFDARGDPIRKLYTKRDLHLDRIVKPIMALKKNQVHLRLWAGMLDDSRLLTARTNGPELFADVVIDGITGEVVVSTDLKDKASVAGYETVIERLLELIPGLSLGENYVKSVQGRYTIWGMDYNREMWQHFLLTDEVAREYLFINETYAPAAYRLRLVTHYQDLGDRLFTDKLVFYGDDPKRTRLVNAARNGRLSCRLVPRLTPEDVDVIDDTLGDVHEVVARTPYMEVIVTEADNVEIVTRFRRVLDRLVHRYHALLQGIRAIYAEANPALLNIQGRRDLEGLTAEMDFTGVNVPIKMESLTKLERLRLLNPDLFGEEYQRACPSRSLPRIVGDAGQGSRGRQRKEAEVSDSSRRSFAISANRKEDFYCPSANEPFIGEVDTSSGAAPCCFSKDPSKASSKGRETAGTKGRVLATNKIATAEARGTLPPAIDQLMKQATGQDNFRLGVIMDSNSLAHAVLRGTDDVYRLASTTARVLMAQQVRQDLIDYLAEGPQACYQELLGLDLASLIADLKADKPLDSRLFYRYFEERFDINLYVLLTPLVDNGRERGTFVIPRAVGRHLRSHRDAPCLALLLNRGSGKAATRRSEWAGGNHELIITMEGKTPFGLYKAYQSKQIFDALLAVNGQDVWLRDPVGRLNGYRNPGSRLNLATILGKATAQVVDAHGHAIKSLYTLDGVTFVLETIPTQPDGSEVITEEELPIPEASAVEISRLFGKPRSVATDADGKITKCWYTAVGIMDVIEIECAPISNTFQVRSPPVRQQVLGQSKQESVRGLVSRYSKVKRDVDMIVELVKWVYDVYRLIDGAGVIFFRDRFMTVGSSMTNVDTWPYYFSEPDEPIVSVESLLRYLAKSVDIIELTQYEDEEGGIIERYRLVIGDQVFFDRIVSMLEDHQKMPIGGLQVFSKRHLVSKYSTYRDLSLQPDTQLVLGKDNFDRQVNAETRGRSPIPVHLLTQDMAYASNPFIYQSGNQYYYVVNIGLSYRPQAWNVYYQWMLSQILTELSSAPVETPPYAMYRIGDTHQLEAYDDHSDGLSDHCRVLSYETTLGHYAVMLPIGNVIEQP